MKKFVSTLFAVILVLAMVAGCAQPPAPAATEAPAAEKPAEGAQPAAPADGAAAPAEAGVVKIAVPAPMTGDNSEYGIGFKAAVEIMVDKWNTEKGGVLGRKIEVVSFDDKNTPEEGGSIAQKIASDPDIYGVIGHFASGVTMTATPTYQKNKIVIIAPSSSHPDYTKEGDFIFRNNPLNMAEVGVTVDLAVNYHKATKLGLLSIKTDWGTSTAEAVRKIVADKYAAQGVEIVADEVVVEGSDDYSPAITKMKEAGVEAVICVSMYSTLAPFTVQYKQVDPNIKVCGTTNSYTDQLLKLGGPAVEGVTFPVVFFHNNPDPAVQEFVKAYADKMEGKVPSSLTAQAYDSAGIILTAIENAGELDRDKIREEVQKIQYPGVCGLTSFDAERNSVKPFTTAIVKDGQFELITY